MLNQVKPVKFEDIPDGSYFCPFNEWKAHDMRVYQKTMEDGGEHNAVCNRFDSVGLKFNPNELVVVLIKE